MKILYNPDDGAAIKDLWYQDTKYFSKEDDQIFEPGMVIRVDDEVADFVTKLYEFVQEIDAIEAKKYMERSKEELKCDKCEFKTRVPVALEGHKRKHVSEDKLEGLGIPVIKKKMGKHEINMIRMQEQIDQEGARDGLEGEGLSSEAHRPSVVMR